MTAFQNYSAVVYTMETKVEHSNDLVKYADSNVLTLANNAITGERQADYYQSGTESLKVTAITKAGNPPIVTATVCADDTKLVSIISYGPNKGQRYSNPPTHPFPVIYRIHKGADGNWRVTAVTAEPKNSC